DPRGARGLLAGPDPGHRRHPRGRGLATGRGGRHRPPRGARPAARAAGGSGRGRRAACGAHGRRGDVAMTVVQLLIGLATLVVNAFFVGAEFALISVRRSQIEPYADRGDRRARSVLWGLEHVSALMAAAQLGITLCTLILGVVAEPAIAHLLEPVFHAMGVPSGAGHAVSFVIALTLATYLHMLLGE